MRGQRKISSKFLKSKQLTNPPGADKIRKFNGHEAGRVPGTPPPESRSHGGRAAGQRRRISPASRGPNGRTAPVGSAGRSRYRTVEGPVFAGNESGTAEVCAPLSLTEGQRRFLFACAKRKLPRAGALGSRQGHSTASGVLLSARTESRQRCA